MFDDNYFMKHALQEALLAKTANEVPIGAVVVCNNQIIARAHNMVELLSDPTAHAEMLAITQATNQLGGKYLPQCTLYVTVEPCTMCAGAIGWAQIGRVVWGADDPKRGFTQIAPNALHPKTKTQKGVLSQEAADLIQQFFKQKR